MPRPTNHEMEPWEMSHAPRAYRNYNKHGLWTSVMTRFGELTIEQIMVNAYRADTPT